uniref:Uncharacterized protein n=1 Tax=mine drainage metagenome TaxID=410659 RepID=E6PTX6_9ZZZZ
MAYGPAADRKLETLLATAEHCIAVAFKQCRATAPAELLPLVDPIERLLHLDTGRRVAAKSRGCNGS